MMNTSRLICMMTGLILLSLAKLGLAGFGSASPVPDRIALLLPLRGAYAEPAQAIRDGFLAAYYQSLSQDPSAPTIRIVDTSSGDIVALYRDAVAQGAKMVVGPLSKEQGVQLLQVGQLTVPTVVLNTLPVSQTVSNLYQLGLAPEDEVKQIVAKAWQDGGKNAVMIAPASAWGQRAAQAFLSQWQNLGGQSVGALYYDDPAQLSSQISQLMHVDQSEKRTKALQRLLLQSKMRTIPYRRQDVDMIVLVAKPDVARQVRPLLSFYYAGKIPIYATSHVYSGFPDPQSDQDLNGIIFCAIPWEMAPQSLPPDLQEILKTVQTTWPLESQRQPQFLALGVDSYRLVRQIGAGTLAAQTDAAIGKLTLQPNHVWSRQLSWAQMIQGKPQPIDKTDQ